MSATKRCCWRWPGQASRCHRQPIAGARAATAAGAETVVIDDGFQNPRLGEGPVDPGGRWRRRLRQRARHPPPATREPVDPRLARADAVVVLGKDDAGIKALVAGRLPVLSARLTPARNVADALRGRRIVAFAGTGQAGRGVHDAGGTGGRTGWPACLCRPWPFYDPDEIMRLVEYADSLGAVPVTDRQGRCPPVGSRHRHGPRAAGFGHLGRPAGDPPPAYSLHDVQPAQCPINPMANQSAKSARRRRRYVGYPLEAAFLYLIYGIFMVLPLDTASAFGGWIGRTIGPRLRTSREARRNLDRAMPELSEARRDEIITGMWDNLGHRHGGISAPGPDLDPDRHDRRRDRR